MATREAIAHAIRNADARAEGMRDRIIASPEAPLAGGGWRVRDAVSHLAARANPLTLMDSLQAMAETGEMPHEFDVDAQNAEQVAHRAEQSVTEILDEMHAAYEDAIAGLNALDDETLARPVKLPAMPQEVQLSDIVLLSMGMHVEAHLGEIEAALEAASG
jgi:hypothetical protein